MPVELTKSLTRVDSRSQYHSITFNVTLLTGPYRGSGGVFWGGLVVTGAYARVGGDYLALTLRSIGGG